MSQARISYRYAKSLLDFAIAQNKLDRIYEDILNLKTACSLREFVLLLKSPIIPSGKKEQIFKAIFENHFDPITFGFFSILLKKGREIYTPEIVEDFLLQYEALNKRTRVTLSTATPLTEELIEAIKSKLTGAATTRDHIDLETRIKPELIGGFVLEYEDQLYDASVAHQLHLMRKALSNNDQLKST
ncbi:MAG: ATP synthase F1 subunit delta [Saprospiraceae bacterium]|nr:ATP synthase F1 subunit delta [Saprospiraceae bacterium]